MTMFHKPIRRAFVRLAKQGVVRCNGRSYMISEESGSPFSGKAKLYINVAKPSAHVADDQFRILSIEEIVNDTVK